MVTFPLSNLIGSVLFVMLAETILRLSVEHGLVALDKLKAMGLDSSHEDSLHADDQLELLYRSGDLRRKDVITMLGGHFQLPVLLEEILEPSPEVLAVISPDLIHKHKILPLALQEDGKLLLAISDPLWIESIDGLEGQTGRKLQPILVEEEVLMDRIRKIPLPRQTLSCSEGGAEPLYLQSTLGLEQPADAPAVAYLRHILKEAVQLRSSDLHFESQTLGLRVRFRIDGRLRTVEGPEPALCAPLISRIKLMAGMSLSEKRLPQDGRIRQTIEGRVIDLRASCLPSLHGESLVLRILEQGNICPQLKRLGFLPDHLASLERIIQQADGLFLVTGPTGSGKSTTLYSALQQLNVSGRKIITVEDPVEYQIKGINQVPVRREIGMHFASALRAILRQSPNLIMIGEIRDRETAETAIHAALTGHMVFSTLHANDAPGALTRMMDLEVKPFLLASSIRGILAQRLVRQVCQQCAVSVDDLPAELLQLLEIPTGEAAHFRSGKGCEHCGGSGYFGRIGIFELLEMSPFLSERVHAGAKSMDFRKRAIESGMRTLRQDGARKVALGLTTAAEVLAATLETT